MKGMEEERKQGQRGKGGNRERKEEGERIERKESILMTTRNQNHQHFPMSLIEFRPQVAGSIGHQC